MRRHWLILALIVLAASALRLWGAGAKSLWLDEALSWRLHSFPISTLVQRTAERTTVHPPFYFILLQVWTRCFGDGEVTMRFLSVLASVFAVFAMFLFCRELFYLRQRKSAGDSAATSLRCGLVGAAVIALNPFQIHLSQQVRGYSLGTFLVLMTSWTLLRALRAQGNARAARLWATYSVLALAFCYTHSLAVLSVVGQGMFAVLYLWWHGTRWRACEHTAAPSSDEPDAAEATAAMAPGPSGRTVRGRWQWPLLAGVLLLAGYLFWVPNLFSQAEAVRTSWVTRPSTFWDVPQQIYLALFRTSADRFPESVAAGACALVVLLGLLCLAAIRGGWAGIFLICAGFIPVALLFVYCQFSIRNIFYARYFAFAQPIWLGAVAAAVGALRLQPERPLLVALLVAWSTLSCWDCWTTIGPSSNPGMRAAAAYILERRSPDELVVAQTPFEFFKLLYYMRDTSPPLLCVPSAERYLVRGTSHLLDGDMRTPDQILQSTNKGLWLVTSHSYDSSSHTVISLSEDWKEQHSRSFSQDSSLERPIVVKHYRREASTE